MPENLIAKRLWCYLLASVYLESAHIFLYLFCSQQAGNWRRSFYLLVGCAWYLSQHIFYIFLGKDCTLMFSPFVLIPFLNQVCGASESQELPPNFIKLAKDAYTPDLIAASDCMLGRNEYYMHELDWDLYGQSILWSNVSLVGKIGYGTVSESLAFKLPFVFVRRDYFNEEPFLRNMLEVHYCALVFVIPIIFSISFFEPLILNLIFDEEVSSVWFSPHFLSFLFQHAC